MQLKTLEIKGFKSFANETIINFNEAVTGIVGPNGSGKSNVVDAIRWVLGEQKGRELRLEQMSDVIFNGTKRRREAPMAQVTLTFENTKNIIPTDYQNVSISRLLYRSGESEYRLNNVTCRLKDITSLFLDTGVGPDSYAIIALNMVEDLLSNKENARRKMFEQAAGISKYKTRKRESINKLKSTNDDLARIEDLLFEINNNLTELEKQAKRSRKFYEMRDKFRSAGLLLAHISIKNLNQSNVDVDEKMNDEIQQLQEIEVNLRTQEADLEKYKTEHLDQEKNLSEHQKKVNSLLDKLRNLESDIQIKQQRKTLFESQIQQSGEINLSLQKKLQIVEEDILKINLDISSVEQELNLVTLAFENSEQELNKTQTEFNALKSDSEKITESRLNLDRLIFEKEKEIAIANNQIETIVADNRRMSDELSRRKEEFVNADSLIKELNTKLDDIRGELSDLQVKDSAKRSKIQELQSSIDQQTGIVNSICRTRDARQNEYNLLKAMVEKMEGFPESMKYLNDHWKKNVPVLSDVISVQEKYRAAIELYLEPYLNYYLVGDDQEAIDAIDLLFRNVQGKANFFILSRTDTELNQITESLPDAIKAVDLIESDASYMPFLRKLLENVFVATDDSNWNAQRIIPKGTCVVSQNGTFLRKSNSLSGGSNGLFEGKRLGRRKNLEKLESELLELNHQVVQNEQILLKLKAELKSVEELSFELEISQARTKESGIAQKLTELTTKYNGYLDVKNQMETRLSSNDHLHQTTQLKIESLRSDLEHAKQNLDNLLETIGKNDEIFNEVSMALANAASKHNQDNLELLKVKNRYNNFLKDLEFKNSQKNEIAQELSINEAKVLEYSNNVKQLDDELLIAINELEGSYEERKKLQTDLSQLEQEYYEVRNYISLADQNIKELQRKIYEFQSSINSLKEKKADINYRINSARERAELEFGTKFEDFKPDEETLQMDEYQLSDRVNYYKVRLDNYGEINPLAMEAYDEMKARCDVIVAQREDIIKAKDSLLETIKEIEETATANFMEAFNTVRGHFQNVFRSLFTDDDDCDLILMDEMDPLECDIDIIAKPKGKRPKSISQLSGGEKTLTAIALLFSLYLLKPAPFCIFDEVDAPLDDVNIEKFNKIVRKFSSDSQFIIITHNKLTMAEVDVLYGVYMEEQGISGVTAVDFRKYEYDTILTDMQG